MAGWINWGMEWDEKTQKWNKIPILPRTGRKGDTHNPAFHVTYEEAKATGRDIGLDIIPQYGRFFIDIDHCLEPGGWSALARAICAMFPGCYVEVSQSGEGIHIIGKIPPGCECIPHGCTRHDIGIEFYTDGRFCAITENYATGSIDHVADTDAYRWLIDEYFPPGPAVSVTPGQQLTSGPVPEWSGPTDDDKLIKKALKSQGMGQLTGAKASFKDLWEGNEAVLAGFFPSDRDAFNRSQADASLCSLLAFWTGRDQERIARLWGMSALGQREKYNRPDYQVMTVVGACQVAGKVYNDGKNPEADMMAHGVTFLWGQEQEEHFEGCVYVLDAHRVFLPDGSFVKPEQFRVKYSGPVFMLDDSGKKTTRNAWNAFSESQVFKCPQVNGTCFDPSLPTSAIITRGGKQYTNVYVKPVIDCIQGDLGPFWDLFWRMLPDERDRSILLSYMAAVVQYQGSKFRWAPVLQGIEGNGKSTIGNIVSYCVGADYVHKVNVKDINSDFNAWILNKILVVADEMEESSHKNVMNSLKELVTEPRISIQAKGRDQATGDNRANFIFCMNNRTAVKKHRTDRRFAIFYTAQQEHGDLERTGLAGDYFVKFYKWLESGGYGHINHFLRTWAIPVEFNPARGCNRAPETSSTAEAVLESRSEIAQQIAGAIDDGLQGFINGWISSIAVSNLLKKESVRFYKNQIGRAIKELDYVPHPGLKEGKSCRLIPAEGGRPKLYIPSAGHHSLGASDVINQYCQDQGYQLLQ